MKIDVPALTLNCEHCFMLSMDGRLSDQERDQFLESAHTLRMQTLALNAADFGENPQAILETNEKIGKVEDMLCALAQSPTDATGTLGFLTNLAGRLDGLVTIPTSC